MGWALIGEHHTENIQYTVTIIYEDYVACLSDDWNISSMSV